MSRSRDPITRARTAALDLSKLWLEARTVIALRMWGLAGGPGPHGENRRIVDEKAAAYANAALAAWQASALAAWRSPFDPNRATFAGVDAWTRALARKTRSNRRRLTRSAARRPLEPGGRSDR